MNHYSFSLNNIWPLTGKEPLIISIHLDYERQLLKSEISPFRSCIRHDYGHAMRTTFYKVEDLYGLKFIAIFNKILSKCCCYYCGKILWRALCREMTVVEDRWNYTQKGPLIMSANSPQTQHPARPKKWFPFGNAVVQIPKFVEYRRIFTVKHFRILRGKTGEYR